MGLHVPVVAVSRVPTTGLPLIVGTGVVTNRAAWMVAVDALVLAVVMYPERVPVTVTVIVLLTSAGVSVYVPLVAPLIATPLRYHWYVSVAVGFQVPGTAVSVEPITVLPVIVGVGALLNGAD